LPLAGFEKFAYIQIDWSEADVRLEIMRVWVVLTSVGDEKVLKRDAYSFTLGTVELR
jgi:hypothetical protein